MTAYMNELHARQHLPHERVVELFQQIENGQEPELARRKLIESNLRLVVSIAKKYQSPRATLDDLIQEGNIGLMKSIEMFDWRKGFRFSTYSTHWIKQSIRVYVMNQRLIRLPGHAAALHKELSIAVQNFRSEMGQDPTQDELLAITGASAKVMKATIEASRGIVSLSDRCKNSGASADHERTHEQRIAASVESFDPFELVSSDETRRIVLEQFRMLSIREQTITRLRFGIIEGIDDDGFDASITEDELEKIEQGEGLIDE